MKVLLTGANGFMGSHLTAALLAAGNEVVAAVRNTAKFQYRFPNAETVSVDFNHDIAPDHWLPRLKGVDAVINCAGVLQGGHGQNIAAIHDLAPRALFDACCQASIRRIIQISAISAATEAGTAYADTKKLADGYLSTLNLDWIILRPSLIYAAGSYGGTSLLRALATFPGRIPIVGQGGQVFRPLHVTDLCTGIIRLLDNPEVRQVMLEPAGPDILTMKLILQKLRHWMGKRECRFLRIPVPLVRFFAKVGDWLGARTFNTTAVKQLLHGNTGNPASWETATGIKAAAFETWLARQPAQEQDYWHAKLYFLAPLLRYSLALVWIATGAITLFIEPGWLQSHFKMANLAVSPISIITLCGSFLDISIGLLILFFRRPVLIGNLQLALITIYTIFFTISAPYYFWLDPMGSLLKNVPMAVSILVWMVIDRERG